MMWQDWHLHSYLDLITPLSSSSVMPLALLRDGPEIRCDFFLWQTDDDEDTLAK